MAHVHRTNPKRATCHASRPHYAKGLCQSCWNRRRKPVVPKPGQVRKTDSPDYFRNRFLIRTYGITKLQQDAMFVAQSGKCAICEIYMTPTKPHTGTSLAVDHDHTTKVVRGLLCHFCNIGIGAFKDNQDALLAAVKYLKDKSCL